MPAKKKAEPTPDTTEDVVAEVEAVEPAPVEKATISRSDPLASGEVSVNALRLGARDNDSVRRLQYALAKAYPGAVNPTGNYQTRTAALVARALDEDGDIASLTKAQAKKVMGSGYTYVD